MRGRRAHDFRRTTGAVGFSVCLQVAASKEQWRKRGVHRRFIKPPSAGGEGGRSLWDHRHPVVGVLPISQTDLDTDKAAPKQEGRRIGMMVWKGHGRKICRT